MSPIFTRCSDRTFANLERKAEKSRGEADRADRGEQITRACSGLLYGIDIRHVGERYAKILANHFREIDKLAAASVEELDDIHEIGLAVAESVYEWFRDPRNIDVVERLKAAGVKMEIEGGGHGQLWTKDLSEKRLF